MSISSTINLPNDVKESEVAEIYMKSWELGLKGVTIYRDGCRTGVLVSDNTSKDEFKQIDAPKRPTILDAEMYMPTVKGQKYLVVIGLFDGKPYEVFATTNIEDLDKISNGSKGTVEKIKKGSYTLCYEGTCVPFKERVSDLESVITRMISTSLRHGADVKFIVEQLNKAEGDITSFGKAIARTLKKYIPDGEVSNVVFEDCETKDQCKIVREEGCLKCVKCGKSRC